MKKFDPQYLGNGLTLKAQISASDRGQDVYVGLKSQVRNYHTFGDIGGATFW